MEILKKWRQLQKVPGGHIVFSKALGAMAPYSGTINATVTDLDVGRAVVQLKDKKGVRNHLNSVHAIALMNLGEIATGLAVLSHIEDRGRGIVTELRMTYHKKARGMVTATCLADIPTDIGSHDVSVQGDLSNEAGEVVARCFATWKIEIFGE